jgi:hypothetical protein
MALRRPGSITGFNNSMKVGFAGRTREGPHTTNLIEELIRRSLFGLRLFGGRLQCFEASQTRTVRKRIMRCGPVAGFDRRLLIRWTLGKWLDWEGLLSIRQQTKNESAFVQIVTRFFGLEGGDPGRQRSKTLLSG